MGVRNKFLKDIRWNLAGPLILVGGAFVWVSTDILVAKLFDRFRPHIERELTKPLGHPVVIGPYKGLRLWGLSLGPTKLEAGLKDDSTVDLSGLTIRYAPVASFFTWRPVLAVDLEDTNIRLIANNEGSYWYIVCLKDDILHCANARNDF